MPSRLEHLEAENARLREALERIGENDRAYGPAYLIAREAMRLPDSPPYSKRQEQIGAQCADGHDFYNYQCKACRERHQSIYQQSGQECAENLLYGEGISAQQENAASTADADGRNVDPACGPNSSQAGGIRDTCKPHAAPSEPECSHVFCADCLNKVLGLSPMRDTHGATDPRNGGDLNCSLETETTARASGRGTSNAKPDSGVGE